jgi:hypothetical protein
MVAVVDYQWPDSRYRVITGHGPTARTRRTRCPKPVFARQASHNEVSLGHRFVDGEPDESVRRSKGIESGLWNTM